MSQIILVEIDSEFVITTKQLYSYRPEATGGFGVVFFNGAFRFHLDMRVFPLLFPSKGLLVSIFRHLKGMPFDRVLAEQTEIAPLMLNNRPTSAVAADPTPVAPAESWIRRMVRSALSACFNARKKGAVPDQSDKGDESASGKVESIGMGSGDAAAPPSPLVVAIGTEFRPREHLYAPPAGQRFVDGIDLASIVVVKRFSSFVLTASHFVTSDDYYPTMALLTWTRFKSATPVAFLLDRAAFTEGMPSSHFFHALFRTLKGLPFEAGMGESVQVAPDVMVNPYHPMLAMLPYLFPPGAEHMTDYLELLAQREMLFDRNVAPFSTVADIVRPRPTDEQLLVMYEGIVPSVDQQVADILKASQDRMVVLATNKIILVSTYDLLKDTNNRRFVFNKATITQANDMSARDYYYIDARFLDHVISVPTFHRIVEIGKRFKNSRLIDEYIAKSPPLLPALSALGALMTIQDDAMSIDVALAFERVRRIPRPDHHTVEIVLRTKGDRARVARILGVPDAGAGKPVRGYRVLPSARRRL